MRRRRASADFQQGEIMKMALGIKTKLLAGTLGLLILTSAVLAVAFYRSMAASSEAARAGEYGKGFASPAASATNLVFNLVSIPGAVWRYQQEKRLWWRLAFIITAGGAPGAWLGAWLRTHHLAARERFEIFVALLLAYLGTRMLFDVLHPSSASSGALRDSSLRYLVA
jgi:uncharacterized membrane protein YfcA